MGEQTAYELGVKLIGRVVLQEGAQENGIRAASAVECDIGSIRLSDLGRELSFIARFRGLVQDQALEFSQLRRPLGVLGKGRP